MGFQPPVNPRPWKSLCDTRRTILLGEARQLLRAGIIKGMISTYFEGNVPKYVWTVDADGLPYEAKIGLGRLPRLYVGARRRYGGCRTRCLGEAITAMFSISADWEALEEGSPEERACFGAIAVRLGNLWLSEGHDPFVRRVRKAPLVSAYHLAEWLTWNWWRLRWEPRSHGTDWGFSHKLASIGAGYVWPNITIFSDGERVAVIAKPSRDQETVGYRYIADGTVVLPVRDFENAIDRFVDQVAGQLDAEGVVGSNLDRLRADLSEERQSADLSRLRKMEALLGADPDEAPAGAVELLIEDENQLGSSAAAELAAEQGSRGRAVHSRDLFRLAELQGFGASPRDAVRLDGIQPLSRAQTPAWLVGQRAARAVRDHLGRPDDPLGDAELAQLLGADPRVLEDDRGAPMAFALDQSSNRSAIVLRSRWKAGRRFELARILGDELAGPHGGRLAPATRSYTYRQKMQRSFAAELLSPFEAVDDLPGR